MRWPARLKTVWFAGWVAALLIRVIPGALQAAVDYDEGVYLAGAGALARGALPWRDFVFLHPPGFLMLLAPLTALSGPLALLVARALSAAVGALNTVLVARLVGGWAGFVSWLFLTLWWESVTTERGAFLEPFMTCFGLWAVTLAQRPTRLAPWLSGLAAAAACAVKLWGGLWWLVALGVSPSRQRARFFLASALAGLVLVGPLVAMAPGEALLQIVQVHLWRPPDGDLLSAVRLHEMFVARSLDATVLVLVGLPFIWFGRQRRLGVATAIATALLITAFLGTPAWWNQYDAALAPFLVLLLGLGLDGLSLRLPRVGAAVLLLAPVLALRHLPMALQRPASDREQRAIASSLKPGTCAFEVFELVLADLPVPPTRPMLIDSYGQGLRDAALHRVRFESAGALFADERSQATYRQQLSQCEALRLGWRGRWQLNGPSQALAQERFGPVD